MTETTRRDGPGTQGASADPAPPPELPEAAAVNAARSASLWSDAWYDLRRNPLFFISLVLIAVLVAMAVLPSLFSSIDATDARQCLLDQARGRPGGAHWFGQDNQGCDVYARTIYGARNSIVIGMMTTASTALFGGFFGLLAGYVGGWLDGLLSRITDVFFAIPIILGGLLILSTFRTGNIWTVTLALGVIAWPLTFRVMRGAVLTTKNQDYVVAARALGAGPSRIMLRHILPNAVAPVIVVATVNLGVFIAAEAALSYLGIGIQSPSISWGLMIADAQARFLEAWWPLVFPAGFLALTVLSFIMLGDAVRDALDPKLR
jgi:oligopeptide transport system permease protein